jgi:hypothetical protein
MFRPCGLNGRALFFASFGYVGCSYVTYFACGVAAMEPHICEIFLGYRLLMDKAGSFGAVYLEDCECIVVTLCCFE